MFEWERAAWTEARTTTRFRMWRIDKGHGADVVDGTMAECLSALYGRDDLTIDYPAPGAEGEVIATVRLAVVESQVLSTPAVGNVAYLVLSGPQPPLMHSGKSHFDLPVRVYEAADGVIAEAEAITREAAPATTADDSIRTDEIELLNSMETMSAGEVIEVDPVTGRVVESAVDRRWRTTSRAILGVLGAGGVGYAVAWIWAPLVGTCTVAGVVVTAFAFVGGLVGGALMLLSYPAMLFALGAGVGAFFAPWLASRRTWLTLMGVLLAVFAVGRIVVPLLAAAVAGRAG